MRKTIFLPLLLSLAACGQSESDLLGAARQAVAQQDYNTARIRLVSALKADPANPLLLDLLADVQLRLGDGAGARTTLDRLAAAGGKGLRFDQLMAEMLVMTDKPEEALKRLGEDAAPESLRIRANALLSLDSTEKAVELWQAGTAQGITRDALRLAYDYGSYLANTGDIARARSLQAQMAAVDANAFETLMLAAEIARETDDAAGAAASYTQAMKAFPMRIEPVCGQADIYDMTGQLKDGLALLQQADARMPGQPCVVEARVSFLAQLGEWGKIRDMLQNFESDLDPASGIGMSYAEAVMRLGRPELARAMFNRALAEDPENPYARLMLGEAQLETGDAASAYATLAPMARSVLAGQRELQLGERAAKAAGSPDATAFAARLAAGSWKQAQAINAQGLAAVARQDWPAAISAWQRLAAPQDPEVQRRLAYALHRAGRSAEAIAAADQALALDPENADTLYTAGIVRTESKLDQARGLALLEQARQREPDNWKVRDALAKAKAAAG